MRGRTGHDGKRGITTTTCHICGQPGTRKERFFTCQTPCTMDADLNGAESIRERGWMVLGIPEIPRNDSKGILKEPFGMSTQMFPRG